MSHQSGIQVSEELSKVFSDAVSSGNVRLLRVSIDKEFLIPNGTTAAQNDFERDYKKHIDEYLDTTTPAYIFIRLDERTVRGEYKWLFLCYVPDHAKVRDKMIYASTRATLTKELGDYRFVDHIYGTEKSELTWDGYKKHLAHKAAEAPLTRREQELAEIKAAEAQVVSEYQGTTAKKSYAPAVSFPFADKASNALSELKKPKNERSFNFVSLYLEKEKVELDKTADISIGELSKTIIENAPRFTYYIYENGLKESLVFIYTCPSSSKIKERMVYSSSKNNIIQAASNELSLQVAKKFETSDLDDLTKAYFDEELSSTVQQRVQASENTTPFIPTGSVVGDRVQMFGGSAQGFKRPAVPGRRRTGGIAALASNFE